MSDVIGRGVIEVSADARKLTAGIDEAKKSLKGLGIAAEDATKSQSNSIDRYIKSLGVAAVTTGKTARELELYKLALRGANAEQLKAADSALRMSEGYAKGEKIGQQIRAGFMMLGAAAATGLIAAYAAFDQLTKKAADFQDMAEKTGDTAQNIASLAVAAGTAGTEMNTVVGASEKLTKALIGVDDDSKAAGAAISALGLNLKDFKNLKAADQMEAVGKALNGFEDGAAKTAVAMALFGKTGAELLPFLKELGAEGGRQIILSEQQIRLADDYADKQAKLRTEISLHAQAIATNLLPALNEYKSLIAEMAKDQDHAATATGLLKSALGGATLVFQTIAVVASDVGFVFQGVGREIGAIIAQIATLAHGDLKGFNAISEAVKEDGIRARAELDKFQARMLSIGRGDEGKYSDPRLLGPVGSIASQDAANNPRKTLKFDGADKKTGSGKDAAGQIAKAQLALDMEQIKEASASLIATYANSEKMMETLHSAGLLSDKDYYANKRELLEQNNAAQEKALTDELARLNKEKLSGKDKLDNQKRIVEVEGKLAKARENAWASTAILSVQEVAANHKIEQSYIDSKNAAQAYIDTLMKKNARDIDGIGKGTKYRETQTGLNAIEDKQTSARQALDGDLRRNQITKDQYDAELAIVADTYAKEVELYNARTDAIDAKQRDWTTGASESLANYLDSVANVASSTENLMTNAIKGMEDSLVEFVKTGKLDFSSLADSIISDIIRIGVQQTITKPLAASLIGMFSANGNAFEGGGIQAFANGGSFTNSIVSSPTLFKFANGTGMMGEAGPEAIMPLSRAPNGRLGVQSVGGSDKAQPQNITVHQSFVVGDVASISTVRQAVANSERRIAAAIGRNAVYGGGA